MRTNAITLEQAIDLYPQTKQVVAKISKSAPVNRWADLHAGSQLQEYYFSPGIVDLVCILPSQIRYISSRKIQSKV
jgi:hypothetical protein